MSAIDKQGIGRAAKVAQVIAEHPGLPMICLAPSTPSDYDSWYHDVLGTEVKRMLFPNEVAELYGGFFGLDCDRYYDDADDVAERIEDYWLWDNDHGRPMEQFDDAELVKTYRPIAEMMTEEMPWHDYIVIDCLYRGKYERLLQRTARRVQRADVQALAAPQGQGNHDVQRIP